MSDPSIDRVAERVSHSLDSALIRLSAYLSYPAISCDPDHFDDVRRLAERIRSDLHDIGLENSRLLELEDALPIVAAEWMSAGADKPTILIYGHLDLQPVKGEPWKTPPHKATRIGDRIYARGAADDMGGWLSHLVVIEAFLEETGRLPCNIRLIIEGEEEIGSPNLERFMDAYPGAFDADAMVLTDCENPSPDIPGLTVSLRGLLELELSCRAIESDVHSGLWGNMVPDVSIALMRLISGITDEDGRMKVGRVDVPSDWSEKAWDVPLSDSVISEGARIVDGVAPLPTRGRPPAEWLWRQPALTVVATTLPTLAFKKNALRAEASAVLSIRLAPGQSPKEMTALLEEAFLKNPPGGVAVSLKPAGWSGEGWLYEPEGPAFEAADRAYLKAWGRPLLQVGVGGSIPFVALFGRRYGDLPLILNGVMDPNTGAHGPNESMHVGIFQKAMLANVYLLDELARLGKAGIR